MRTTIIAIFFLVSVAIVAAFIAQSSLPSAPAATHGTAELSADIKNVLGFVPTEKRIPRTNIEFTDIDGGLVNLADKRGKVVLLNLWATWCPPCVREMPSLDRLQAAFGGPDFEVVALSQDRAGAQVVTPFYERLGLTSLEKYLDPTTRALRAFNVLGLPTTILIDREGNEAGRVTGPAEWDSDAAVALIRHYVDEPVTASVRAE